jgi:hypothetical protein
LEANLILLLIVIYGSPNSRFWLRHSGPFAFYFPKLDASFFIQMPAVRLLSAIWVYAAVDPFVGQRSKDF